MYAFENCGDVMTLPFDTHRAGRGRRGEGREPKSLIGSFLSAFGLSANLNMRVCDCGIDMGFLFSSYPILSLTLPFDSFTQRLPVARPYASRE